MTKMEKNEIAVLFHFPKLSLKGIKAKHNFD